MRLLRPSRPARGFTLLEVIISIGILAIALLAIGDLNGGAVRMHAYAKRLTIAVQLARGKMLDIQYQLRKDGLSDFSKEYHGTFEAEGEPEYKWKAQVIKPEMDVDPSRIMDLISSGMGIPAPGNKDSGAAPTPLPGGMQNPLAAGGPLSGMIDMQVKQMTEVIKQSVREVKLTVSWKVGGQTEDFDMVEHVIILPNAQQNAAANATPMTPGAPGTNGTGVPGMTPGMAPGTGMPGMTPPTMMGGSTGIPQIPGMGGGFRP